MKSVNFDPFCDALRINFKCPCCEQELTYDLKDIPNPNWLGEYDGVNSDFYEFECPNCKQSFFADVVVSEHDGTLFLTTQNGENYNEVEIISLKETTLEE